MSDARHRVLKERSCVSKDSGTLTSKARQGTEGSLPSLPRQSNGIRTSLGDESQLRGGECDRLQAVTLQPLGLTGKRVHAGSNTVRRYISCASSGRNISRFPLVV